MEANSIKRYEIEWTTFRTQAFADAGAAQTSTQTYDAIRLALERIGDNHRFCRTPEAVASASRSGLTSCLQVTPAIEAEGTTSRLYIH